MLSSGSTSLDHFRNLAARGSRPGSSSGEKRAWRLAWAVIREMRLLDGGASQGFLEFVESYLSHPEQVTTWVERVCAPDPSER